MAPPAGRIKRLIRPETAGSLQYSANFDARHADHRALKENETLVIGGLIQDNTQRTESRIPVLGDIPLIGRAFRNETLNGNRNELIISVTPHVVTPGQQSVYPGPPLPAIPTPQPLPTLEPGAILPTSLTTPVPMLTVRPAPPFSAPAASRTSIPAGRSEAPIMTPSTSPSASPTTQATASANTFVYGAQPSSNVASSGDPGRIIYATLSPTALTYGQAFSLAVTTSTNITQLSLSYSGVAVSIPQTGPGQWSGTLPFTLIRTPAQTGAISLVLTASKTDGTRVAIPIPVTVTSQ